MKNLKKLSSVLMLILFMYIFIDVEVEATSLPDSDIDVSVSEQTQLINDFFGSIGQDNWDIWVSYYVESVQADYQKFVDNVDNVENNVGILTVQKAQVLDINKVSNAYAPKTYPELQSFFENENTYECYTVKINTQVEKNNGYFSDGISYHLVIIVKDNGIWKVGTMCGCPTELLDSDASIDVMDENGTVHKNESFTEFVVNATCNEIGNEGYSNDALKANVMAIKMCGWWAIAGNYRPSVGIVQYKYAS